MEISILTAGILFDLELPTAWTQGFDSAPLTVRELQTESERGINKTVFTLEPLGEAGDMLLEVIVTYSRGSASYHWQSTQIRQREPHQRQIQYLQPYLQPLRKP